MFVSLSISDVREAAEELDLGDETPLAGEPHPSTDRIRCARLFDSKDSYLVDVPVLKVDLSHLNSRFEKFAQIRLRFLFG